MRNTITEVLLKRVRWAYYQPVLARMTKLEEFLAFMDKLQDPTFKEYEGWKEISRREFASAVDTLGIDFREKGILDIGPGYGASLEIARERGANPIEFIDYSPFVCTFNRLRGFTPIKLDARRGLGQGPQRKYDVIWTKGTFSADRLIARELSLMSVIHSYPRLEPILDQLELLCVSGGKIIFCPHWKALDGGRVHADVKAAPISRIFVNRGYRLLPYIDGHNTEPVYPITFFKQVQ